MFSLLEWIGSCTRLVWRDPCLEIFTADTVVNLGWGTGQPWAIACALITLLVLIARRLPQQPQEK